MKTIYSRLPAQSISVLAFILSILISFSVSSAQDIIIDNGDPGTSSTGVWQVSGVVNFYDEDSLYSRDPGATYTFEALANGTYEVSLWWTSSGVRCSDVPVDIYDGESLIDTVFVNHQADGGQWNLIGTYNFTGTAKVVINAQTDTCSTCADAVKFSGVVPPELDRIEIEGPLTVNENSGADYNCRAFYANGSDQLVEPDIWSVDCSTYAEISATGLLSTFEVDADTPCRISASYTEGATVADAVYDITILDYVFPPEGIIDNGDPGTSSTGVWQVSGVVNFYDEDSLYSRDPGATYTFEALANGTYEVSLWWTSSGVRCSDVPVDIYDGESLIDTVFVNHQADGGQWNLIGTYNFTGTAKVVINAQTDTCSTCADAVKFSGVVPPELDRIEIEGPLTVNENSGADYNCRAFYANGSDQLVEPDIWSVDCSTYAEISATGLLSTFEVDADTPCRISASYTEGATVADAVYDITILDYVFPPEGIIDNGDPGTSSTGVWQVSGVVNFYDEDSLYSRDPGATYTFEALANGTYEVSLWWTSSGVRCSDVPVDIYDGESLIDTVFVNHQADGGQWNLIGTYNFTGTAKVVINAQTDTCSTCADAVKFSGVVPPELDRIEIEGPLTVNENSGADYNCRAFYANGSDQLVEPDIWSVDCSTYAEISATGLLSTFEVDADTPCRISASYTEGATVADAVYDITILDYVFPPEGIIDNGDPGTSSTGVWQVSGVVNFYDEDSLYSRDPGATYTFEALASGTHEVFLWWTSSGVRCSDVPVDIYDGESLVDTVFVNHQADGGQWNLIGTYNFTGTAKVVINAQTDTCSTCADAVKFSGVVPPELDRIEIEGPLTVNENSGADYNCRAFYANGSDQLVEPDIWSVDCSTYAEISATGLLSTFEVDADTPCRISASYTEGATVADAVYDITILDYVFPPEGIIDNGDPGTSSTGVWQVSGVVNFYDEDSLYSRDPGATYTFEALANGTYEVSLWWTSSGVRCSDVPVDIYDGESLIDTVFVNHQADGGQWNLIGTYNFTGTAKVVINAQTDTCSTCADAVKFSGVVPPELDRIEIEGPLTVNENSGADYNCRAFYANGSDQLVEPDIWSVDCSTYAEISATGLLSTFEVDADTPCRISASYTEGATVADAVYDITILDYVFPPEGIIDNGDPGTSSTGVWQVSGVVNFYDEDSLYSRDPGATYTFEALANGTYEVSLWWTSSGVRCSDVPVDIYDGESLIDTVFVNHQADGGQWNLIGTYNFTGTAKVVINAQTDTCSTCADAVRFNNLNDLILDNSDPAFFVVGEWISATTWPQWYGNDYVWTREGDGTKSASWNFEVTSGNYDIYAWWTSLNFRAPYAPYTIINNGEILGTVFVDQRFGGGQFNLLTSLSVEAGNLEVVLTDDESGSVVADAVKVSLVDQIVNYAPNGIIDSPSGDIVITEGGTLNFSGTGNDPDGHDPLTYHWIFGTGSGVPNSNLEDPGMMQFEIPGTYTVIFTVTDSYGESDPLPATINVHVSQMKEPIIVDNSDKNSFSTQGQWYHSTTWPEWYGNDYQYSESGSGLETAMWHFEVTSGIFEVGAWWTSSETRATDAPYTIYNNGLALETVYLDQTTGGSEFYTLGTYKIESGGLDVVLTDSASGTVIADAVQVLKRCKDMPCVSIIRPTENSFQSSNSLYVLAEIFENNVSDPSVKFVLDSTWEIIDNSPPYEALFDQLASAEHNIHAVLMDAGNPIFGNSTEDNVGNVAVGDYYVAVGDSITHGCGDYVFSDDMSQDGRSTGPGYSSILSDLLRSHKNYPHYIANEGVGGDQSSDGVDLIRDTLLTRHPDSQWYLIQYGTNDVNGLFPTPSGLGLLQGDPGYPGSFKDNMQQMIEMIRSDGKDAFLAKVPMVRGPDLFSDPYDNPEEAPENLWIKEYNLVVDELWVENGITVTAPDFYNHFKNHLWDEYYDNTHPNGTGYNSMANIWFQMLTQ